MILAKPYIKEALWAPRLLFIARLVNLSSMGILYPLPS